MEKEKIDASFLRQFYQDVQQMVYYVLQTKGIQAHRPGNKDEKLDIFAVRCIGNVDRQDRFIWLKRPERIVAHDPIGTD